jgi:hypothetical protein
LWLFLWFGIGGTLTTAVLLGLAGASGRPPGPVLSGFRRLFHSPFAGDGWNLDRWNLHSRSEALYYPFVFTTHSARVAEVPFTDWRIAAAYLLVPAALSIRLLRRASGCPPLAPGFGIVVATMAVGYVLWLAMLTYYRYAVTLELLAPLAIALAVMALPLSWPVRSLLVGAIMLELVATTRPADWGRLPWTRRLVEGLSAAERRSGDSDGAAERAAHRLRGPLVAVRGGGHRPRHGLLAWRQSRRRGRG